MVKRIPLHFIRQFLFWMLYFQLGRLVFVLFNIRAITTSADASDLFGIFWHSIYLDTSATCYIMAFPFVLLLLQSLLKLRLLNTVNLIYSFLVIFLIALITSSELPLYREWGIKLHYKALEYLYHPTEILRTAKNSDIIISGLLIVTLSVLAGYLYHKFIHRSFILQQCNYAVSAAFLLITPPLIAIGLRGGLQQIPINQSDVYFSKSNVVNLAAVNSAWNLAHSIEQNKFYMDNNPYISYPDSEAERTVSDLHRISSDSTERILRVPKPNIVLIILESWSADLVAALGGEHSITPRFDTLAKSGFLFTNCYATGDRSDQGMAALLSGFPAQPTTSIIKQPNKFQQLPCIIKDFKKDGYRTSFLFGGQLSYGNIKGYVYYNEFDVITEGKDLTGNELPVGKLGLHDEYIFNRLLADIDKEPQPFFSTLFTLSSHSPYDQPMDEVLHWGGNEREYINSAYYTDSCLGDFFEKAKEKNWYNNTLFIMVADHSHNSYRNHSFFEPAYRKIPMLLYGEVLKREYRGKPFEKLCSQVDFTSTLLAQFGMDHSSFKWSKNLLNPHSPEFAYYCFVDGMGWLRPQDYFVYQKTTDRILFSEFSDQTKKDVVLREGKSYLQVLFQEYLDY